MNNQVTITFTENEDYSRQRLGPVTLTIPHGDVWVGLVDDFVAFLRMTGYHIDEPWVDEYTHHKKLGERAAQLLANLEYDKETGTVILDRDGDGESRTSTGEDEMEPAPKRRRNATPSRRRRKDKRPATKKTKKKAKK